LKDKIEAQAEDGRQFQREGPIMEKNLDLATIVVVRGTKVSPVQRAQRTKG